MLCPSCKGSGKITFEIEEMFSDNPVTKSILDCILCDGTGDALEDDIKRLHSFWCKCSNPSNQTRFYNDNEHPDCSKHHYRCLDCGRVIQTG